MLRQHQPPKPKAEAESTSSAAPGKAPSGSGGARDSEVDEAAKAHPFDAAAQLRDRESALRAAEAALAQERRAHTEALAQREAALAHKESTVEKVCGASPRARTSVCALIRRAGCATRGRIPPAPPFFPCFWRRVVGLLESLCAAGDGRGLCAGGRRA